MIAFRTLLGAAVLAAPFGLLAQTAAPKAPADLIVTNARVYTADDARPLVEAFAVRDGRIAFVGSQREAAVLRGPNTRVVDAGGRTVIPGMVDAHAHFSGLAQTLRSVDLTGTNSLAEVIARVVAKSTSVPKGTWITGRGWDQNDWGVTDFPTHEALTAALPDHPVLLERVDGHAMYANMAAMKVAGVTAASKAPVGGQIIKDAKGNPTGVFVDNASNVLEEKVPAPTAAEYKSALKEAIALMHSWGLTGMHDAGASRMAIDTYEELAKAKELNLRLYVMISDDKAALDHYFAKGPQSALYDGQLWVRAVKLYADGAMGSRGAALLEPYSDDPNNSGLLKSTQEHIRDVAERGLKAGFQINSHAIGDRGNRVVLDAYEQALKTVPTADHRFRVEHAQILHYDDIPRFAQLGVIPSMQASHQTSDMYWIGKRLGPTRLYGAYPWQSLLQTGVVIPNGSDFPVEQVNPLISFHAAIARQDARDWPAGGWFPEQKMSREDALRSMTIWPAYAGFQEASMGSLTAGKFADFVILDTDIMRVPSEMVMKARVVSTWVGGKAVFEAR
ncbi:amidohydrolase [Gemmatimonas sp.]|jgi:predicted amidohydrolase YtcJ|uniref:amidohydrolase n=1 Tax=Gemmatimonas sp. TaxID=1962908 RepID=UPI0037BFBA13